MRFSHHPLLLPLSHLFLLLSLSLPLLLALPLTLPATPSATPSPAWLTNPPSLEILTLPGQHEQGGHNIHPTSDGGCIVAACVSTPGKGRDMGVYKLTPDLKLDPAFGTNGLWTAGSTGVDQAIDAIEIIGPDGKPDGYLVAGYTTRGDADFANCGYHPGKPGATTSNTEADLVIARLTRDGKLDPRFGHGGLRCYGGSDGDLNIYHPSNYSEPGNKILQTPDGNFLIAAFTRSKDGDLADIKVTGYSQSFDTWIFKIDARGDFVRTFGDKGHLRIGLSPTENMGKRPNNEYPWSIKADPAGGFIASGYHFGLGYSPSGKKSAPDIIPSPGNASRGDTNTEAQSNDVNDAGMDGWLFRATADGRLRADWAQHGISFFGGSRQEKMYDHAVTPDGGYIVCGRTSSNDLAFARPGEKAAMFGAFLLKLTPKGTLDTTFGTYKRGITFLPECGQQVSRVAILPNGDILAACVDREPQPQHLNLNLSPSSAAPSAAPLGTQFVLVRLDPTGRPLRYWSLGAEGDDWLCGMDIDAQGRVLMTGYNDKGRPPGEKKPEAPDKKPEAPDKKGVHPWRDLVVMRITPSL